MAHELAVGFWRLSPIQAAVRVDVHDHVDTGSIEDGSAVIMVGARVHVVDMNGVDLVYGVSVGHE